MSTHSADRERPEWPPHPDRLFMALAAAHYETDGDDGEWEALLWLERQGTPSMWASDATQRETMTTYVPVNDPPARSVAEGRRPSAQQVRAGLQLLPENRSRQPRQFPVAIPYDPKVYLVWSEAPSPEISGRVGNPMQQGGAGRAFGVAGPGLGRGRSSRTQPGSRRRGGGSTSAAGVRPRQAGPPDGPIPTRA